MEELLGHLQSLLHECDFVHLMVCPQTDEWGRQEPPLVRASYRREGKVVTRVAASLGELAEALVGDRCTKRCSRCGEVKPWAEFPRAPRKKDRPEGRHSHCKLCDRQRKLKYSRRKAPAPTPPGA